MYLNTEMCIYIHTTIKILVCGLAVSPVKLLARSLKASTLTMHMVIFFSHSGKKRKITICDLQLFLSRMSHHDVHACF